MMSLLYSPYDVGEIRVTAARSRRVPSIDFLSAAGRALPPRPFQTLVSHVDVISTVAHNCDDVIVTPSLRRRGDEIRVTAARSPRVPSIDFLSGWGEHFEMRLRRSSGSDERATRPPRAFQTLISHSDVLNVVGLDKHTVIVVRSHKQRGRSVGFVAHAAVLCLVVKVCGFSAGSAA